MFTSSQLAARRIYTELEYARHFPQAYIDRVKRIVPKKVYDNRFGAPAIVRWNLPPDDYIPTTSRPWEGSVLKEALYREKLYHSQLLRIKFFRKRVNRIERIPDEEWVFFAGDMVQVMVGKDKGMKGLVSHVIREANAVFVDGLHTKLEVKKDLSKAMGVSYDHYIYEMNPLYVDKDQVKLIDPNDNAPCKAKWILNSTKTDYIRVSERTGYQIPLPSQAFVTYEYISPSNYLEVQGKDTPSKIVLKKTYEPKLETFENEIEKEYQLKPTGDLKPTYWY